MLSSFRRRVRPPVFRWFALASFVSMILIVLTGAAVRLTGSGLGCPDWPTCFRHCVTGSWRSTPFIEFGNRLVTVAAVLRRRSPPLLPRCAVRFRRRRDLMVLSGLLIGGIVADAVLGAFVVYSKLNPVARLAAPAALAAMVVIGAILYHRSKYVYGPGRAHDLRDPHFLWSLVSSGSPSWSC